MSRNADNIVFNDLRAARKEKAKAILDDVAKPFGHWTHISDFIKYGSLLSLSKDDPKVAALLETGYVEIVEPEPCEKARYCTLADPNRVALQPTERGLTAYYWFTKYNEQRRATDDAYRKGKKDVTLQIFENIANSVGLDFEDLCDTGE